MQRKASAVWQGDLKSGKGSISTDSGVLRQTQYSFSTRFENGVGTNPEELLAAAHAGCFTMALSAQLGNAGPFLQALQNRQKEIPNLISGHLGNRVPTMPDVQATTPIDPKQNPQKIAALPIGGRVKMDPWADSLELIKSKPVGTVAEREKMPFEVTPFMPYLVSYGQTGSPASTKPIAASAAADGQPGAGATKPN